MVILRAREFKEGNITREQAQELLKEADQKGSDLL